MDNYGEIIIYQTEDGLTKLDVRMEDETVWLTQQQMAELFQTSRTNVVDHIKNIYEEDELDDNSTCRKFRQVRMEGNRQVTRELPFYNLDMIIASPIMCNHKARYNNDRDIEIFGRMNPVDKSDDPKIADIMPYKSRSNIFKDKYFKLESDKVCKTITAHMKFDCNMYIHPSQARGLTPREAARVQSYPDDYFFRGSYTKTYMQIGNSVPPLLGRAIAQAIREFM